MKMDSIGQIPGGTNAPGRVEPSNVRETRRLPTGPLVPPAKTTRLDTADLSPALQATLQEAFQPRGPAARSRKHSTLAKVAEAFQRNVVLPTWRLLGLPVPTLGDFLAEHKAAVDKLSKDDRKKLEKLVSYFIAENQGRPSWLIRSRLEPIATLLESGRLAKDDPIRRQSILDLVARSPDASLGDWASDAEIKGKLKNSPSELRERLLANILRNVAHADRIYQGYGTNDCTTAVLQGYFASESPVEYTHFALGLAFSDAGVAPSGRRFPARLDSLKSDLARGSGRDIFDALFQGSLIHYARKTYPVAGQGDGFTGGRAGPKGAYGKGRAGSNGTYGAGRASAGRGAYGGEKPSSEGLTFGQMVRLTADMFGSQALYFAAEVNQSNRSNVVNRLVQVFADPASVPMADRSLTGKRSRVGFGIRGGDFSLARLGRVPPVISANSGVAAMFRRFADRYRGVDENVEVPVGIVADDGGLHQVLVRKIKEGKVTYSDPGDGLVKTMSLDEFGSRLSSVILPRDLSPIQLD